MGDNMEKVNEPFLEKTGIIAKIKKKITGDAVIKEELAEPLLFLMRNDGYMDVIEGVQPGTFTLGDGDVEKSIQLTPEKQTSLRYGDNYYKCWVAHEDCATPFPQDPIHLAEQFHKIVQKLRMNWRDRDEATLWKAKGGFWFKVLIGLGLLIVLIFTTGAWDAIISTLNSGTGQAAAKVAVEVVKQNITNATVTPGVIIS